ncbi:hypothetical protein SESBI_42888 [Sesbania bispinosa]|nr:hypothetical protein SESBI_42888 [Sesbania bispinosa]
MATFSMDSEWESGESGTETLQIRGGGYSSLQEDSDTTSSDGEELMVDAAVNEAEQVASGSVVKKRRLKPEEIRTRGQGALEGYFIKIDSENKEEDDYDFVSFPWVESLVARTRSIYADEKTISAFVDCRDVVDGNLLGNVECTWMLEDDRVCSRVPSVECRPFVLKALVLEMKKQRLANAEKDKAGASLSIVATEIVAPSSSVFAARKRIRAEKAPILVTGQASTDKGASPGEGKLKVKAAEEKYNIDFQQLNSDAARSYGLGFEQALVQVKHFNPAADVSECDPLKELVNNVLMDLGDDEEELVLVGGHNDEEVVDSQGAETNKPPEESDKVGNEEQGNAPLV